MLGNDFGVDNPTVSEELEYPLENLLTKLVGSLAVCVGWCAISTEAVLEADPCKLMLVAYGTDIANRCVNSTADACCPPTQRAPSYRPHEMDVLEDGNGKKLR